MRRYGVALSALLVVGAGCGGSGIEPRFPPPSDVAISWERTAPVSEGGQQTERVELGTEGELLFVSTTRFDDMTNPVTETRFAAKPEDVKLLLELLTEPRCVLRDKKASIEYDVRDVRDKGAMRRADEQDPPRCAAGGDLVRALDELVERARKCREQTPPTAACEHRVTSEAQ